MKHLEMIKLEPYEAPALEEIAAVALLHGSSGEPSTNPSGLPDPGQDPTIDDGFSGEEE